MLFRHIKLKVIKLSRNVDRFYHLVTVPVSAKNVKMVTSTFRSKFLQQSGYSVTMKSNKAFPKRRNEYHFVTVRYQYDFVVDLTLQNLWIQQTFFSVSLPIKISSFGGTFCLHRVDSWLFSLLQQWL
jgi:hypothetical protein